MKSDSQIQRDVLDQLKWDPVLNAAEIGVSVKNGVVTLSGIVNAYYKKIAAENAVKKVSGVKGVAEDIQVGISVTSQKTDAEIAQNVITALSLNSSIPYESIRVKVEDGAVWLEGEVTWDFQRTAANNAIESVAGVKSIHNYLTIKPTVTVSNVKQKITAAFHRSATIDAEKIFIDVDGSKVTLKGKVRSFAEREDAGTAAWAAPGVTVVDNQLELEVEELVL